MGSESNPASLWVKLGPDSPTFVCESGCFNHEFNLKEERCHHSIDATEDGRQNAAHWKRNEAGGPSKTYMPHMFLCNYHYEELVLFRRPDPSTVEVTLPSAEEFAAAFGEVK